MDTRTHTQVEAGLSLADLHQFSMSEVGAEILHFQLSLGDAFAAGSAEHTLSHREIFDVVSLLATWYTCLRGTNVTRPPISGVSGNCRTL